MSELCKNVVIKYKLELRSLSWNCALSVQLCALDVCTQASNAVYFVRNSRFFAVVEIYINGFSQKMLFCALYICAMPSIFGFVAFEVFRHKLLCSWSKQFSLSR